MGRVLEEKTLVKKFSNGRQFIKGGISFRPRGIPLAVTFKRAAYYEIHWVAVWQGVGGGVVVVVVVVVVGGCNRTLACA